MVGLGFGIAAGLGAAGQLASGLMGADARRGEIDQQIRAISMKRDQTLGIARAKAAASGTTLDSKSTQMYLAGLASEFDTELGNLKKTRDQGFMASVVGSLAGFVGQGADIYGKLGSANNWWQPSPVATALGSSGAGQAAGILRRGSFF